MIVAIDCSDMSAVWGHPLFFRCAGRGIKLALSGQGCVFIGIVGAMDQQDSSWRDKADGMEGTHIL